MVRTLSARKVFLSITTLIFCVLFIWWAVLFFKFDSLLESQNLFWAASYQLVALFGGLVGLFISKYWGGFKSVMGRAIIALSAGLLLQVLGQSVFSFYNIILHVEIPYPSLADIGFFGSIPLYIYGAFLLGKASGVAFSLKSFTSKAQALILPILMLSVSYYSFLREYNIDTTDYLRIFLDFGYPLGQATYVSVAILIYLLSNKFLGGVMKHRILLILWALVIQYAADYNFLYQTLNGTWINGGYGDFIYLVAYFLMAVSLINLVSIFETKQQINIEHV